MKKYANFIKEQQEIQQGQKCTLTIETDDAEYTDEWKLTIDISKIVTDYTNKSISVVDFNNEYATILTNNKQNISNVHESCWMEIEPIVTNELKQSLDENSSESIYNKIYDIFDKFEIYLKQS